MNPRRLYAPVVLGLVLAGAGVFASLTRTWGETVVRAEGLPEDQIAVTGSEAMPVVSALGIVLLASGLAVLAGSRRVRQVLGVLVALVAAGCLVWVVAGSGDAVSSAVLSAVRESASFTGDNAPGDVAVSPWRWATAAALALAFACGVVTARFAGSWPTMSSRYESPAARATTEDETDMWKAFDDGRDPTE
ncbi:Trp biosynthesis-associated membrane protein [Aeromicrobium piscarium]|uniref:Trp biosynthesis-associated membrane protein n=1 Tax=Aeromicrobium piscarium TaxID=2590901 RepID=A0A554S9S2_9ACTN|nr:Trp biosynthesis-associated membrane protein [Aeromicrobium piscarium]TSD63104.1 Trp biosynthesis-associated membrane protein [Aeromicrobium piscarium]